jgi:phosphoribosyl 1,2-cyclic phosphodiesterase
MSPAPPLRITVLGSGSGGNAMLVEGGDTRILVDAGIPLKELRRRMALAGCGEGLTHVVLTHAHGDHHGHVEEVAAHYRATVFLTESVRRCVRVERLVTTRVYGAREPFDVGGVHVRPCPLPHDAPQVALRFEREGDSAVLATDLGEVPEGLLTLLRGARVALLESNHDRAMLASGPYSQGLKRRVAGPRGHLSNEQSHALLRRLDREVETVVLMHLSETNNRPEIAREVAADALQDHAATLLLATQRTPLVVPRAVPRQLTLF